MIDLDILRLTGVLAAFWMLVGVLFVSRKYPGYSHIDQVMSELGAVGRPTFRIHPIVNNFPLAALFIIFGISIVVGFSTNWHMVILGSLTALHGVCHIATGAFPCDEDLGVPTPSGTQIIHNVAGSVMLVTLLIAASLSAFSSSVVAPAWFRGFSLGCLVVSLVFGVLMAKSLSTGHKIGLYQRVSYGALVLWVAVFSGVSYEHA